MGFAVQIWVHHDQSVAWARPHLAKKARAQNSGIFVTLGLRKPLSCAKLQPMGALDEILATIRRLPLPERLRLIERATLEVAEDTPKPAAVAERGRKLSVDEFLAARLTPPAGVGPVSLQDMERAIAEGATGRGGV